MIHVVGTLALCVLRISIFVAFCKLPIANASLAAAAPVQVYVDAVNGSDTNS